MVAEEDASEGAARNRRNDRDHRRDEINAAGRAWRAAHRDRINAHARQLWQDKPEEEKQRIRARNNERQRASRRANPEKTRATARRYRESHPEQVRDTRRRWEQEHPDYRAEYRAANRDRIAAWERNRQQKKRDITRAAEEEAERAARRRETQREAARERERRYRERHPERRRESAQKSRERRQQADPDGYRQRANAAWHAYYQRNREEILARQTERRRIDPAKHRAAQHRYYQTHRDEEIARSTQWRKDNPDRARAWATRYRKRETRRGELGLPPYRRHALTPDERIANRDAANAFFTRPSTPDLVERVESEAWTPDDLVAAYRLQGERFRADLSYPALEWQIRERRRTTDARLLAAHIRDLERTAHADAEAARLDAIAAPINAKLRTQPRHPPAMPGPTRLDPESSPPDPGSPSL